MANKLKGDPKDHNASKFKDGISGHCLCGSITVTINAPDLFAEGAKNGHLCHCANCRKVAGSFASTNLIIDQDKVQIEDKIGTMKMFEDKDTESGKPLHRFFCGTCGNPIKSETENLKGKYIIKTGMFPRIPEPEIESFAGHRQSWMQGKYGDKRWKFSFGGEEMKD